VPDHGQKPGHVAGVALDWAAYIDGLVGEHGSLAAVSERVAATRGHRDDVESIARALRRLRGRGSLAGGTWGDRLIATFGLPAAVGARLRFMGSYHSRFVDLPVPLCTDLIQLWDRPPTSESHNGRRWLSLARATLALRARDQAAALQHLEVAARARDDDPRGAIEIALSRAVITGATDLAKIPALLEQVTGDDGACLRARYVGQVAHAMNHAGDIDGALALHAALPDAAETPAFARSRRANGLAYGHHRRREAEFALHHARLAASHAGDAGHVRLRAMALLMVVRVTRDAAERAVCLHRARAIATALDDAVLLSRCAAAVRADA
jgi:hypothetical protein